MTAKIISLADASSTELPDWDAINWHTVLKHVRQLQMRIAKAFREGKHRKAKALQWILAHSYYAKLLAVKRVVSNKGAKTPGIDGVTWKTSLQKIKAATSLKRRGYKTQPLRRIYIPKKQKGKLRPLSIPVMKCRAQQALHLLSLEPIAEIITDKNSYGFRPLRSTADAIAQCFNALARETSAQFILEGDIKSCFDEISHKFLVANAPMDKEILGKWLAAGYVDNKKLHATTSGTPQGGIASPTLLNVTLSGLEMAVKSAIKRSDKVNVVTYADDFVITGATREVLERVVKPVVEAFLSDRGLRLSQEKTTITHINDGFDFLGMNIRKYNGKLIIKPAKSNVKRFLADIRDIIKSNKTAKTESIIYLLNPKIRGWANYYRHVCSKETFSYVDHKIFEILWRWAVRRHPNKGKRWIKRKYFRQDKMRNWSFSCKVKDKRGNSTYLNLAEAVKVPIVRHIKVKADATPYNRAYHDYYSKLVVKRKVITESRASPKWWMCWWELFKPQKKEKTGSSIDGLIKA